MLNQTSRPMSALTTTTQQIVWFRRVRPLFDLTLLLAILFALITLRNMDIEQQLDNKPNLKIRETASTTETLFLEQHFNEESDLWQSWTTWINTLQPGSGQCLMETKSAVVDTPFYLLCFGKAPTDVRPTPLFSKASPSENLFVPPVAPRTIQTIEPAKQISEPAYRVQGWMITKQGQKTFDPTQKKWLP